MPRTTHTTIPEVAGIDLDFRPASYWEADNPTSAIVQNIKGQLRRHMASDFIAGRASEVLGEIDSDLLEDTLSPDLRRSLGLIGPSWMGGEYLPNYARGEVEIARIVLQSTTMDVYSIRARRCARGTRISYRIVDEYASPWTTARKSSARPLTLRQLVALIDTARTSAHEDADDVLPLIERTAAFQLEYGETPERAVAFVSVESPLYPQIGQYYATRVLAWVQARVKKEEPEDEE